MARLIIKMPDGEEFVHELRDDMTTVGRASTNIIQVKDEQASREHCRIVREGAEYRVEDLKSRNGILLNDRKVESQTLRVGDVIRIGEHRIVYDAEVAVSADELGTTVAVDSLTEEDLKSDTGTKETDKVSEPKYVLYITGGPDKGKQVEVGDGKVTLGRHSSNTLQLQDEAASNYHAEVSKEAIGFVMTDLGSTNGTKINGEKIVKSPLAHGTEITIGQTTIVFKDVNRQVDEEQVFGTVVLDTEQLEKELSGGVGGGGPSVLGPIAAIAAAVVVLLALSYGVYKGVGALLAPDFGPPDGSLISANFSFDGDTGPTGAPRGWEWDTTRSLIWAVSPDDDAFDDNPARGSLTLKRSSDARPNAYTECRYIDPIVVEPGQILQVDARAKSLAATGSFGIAVHWKGGESFSDTDYVSLWGPQQQWKEITDELVAPAWARSAVFALYSVGNEGSVFFDHVSAVPGPVMGDGREMEMGSSGVGALVNPVGMSWLKLRGIRAVNSVEVVSTAGQGIDSEQRFARAGTRKKDGGEIIVAGDFVEYTSLGWIHYEMRYYQSQYGMGVNCMVSAHDEIGVDEVALRFEVGGQFAVDELPEIMGEAASISYRPRKVVEGAREVRFNGTRGDTFALFSPDRDVPVRVTRKGKTIFVDFIMNRKTALGPEPTGLVIEVNDRSILKELRLSRLKDAVNEALKSGTAREVYAALDALSQAAVDDGEVKSFIDARSDVLDARMDGVRAAVQKMITDLRSAGGDGSFEATMQALEDYVQKNAPFWQGTPGYAVFEEAQGVMKELSDQKARSLKEKEANEFLAKAYSLIDAKAYPIALTYVDNILNNHPTSEAAAKIRDSNLRRVIEDAIARKERERSYEARVLKHIQNYEMNKRFRDAINIIKTDPDFPVFPDNKRIREKLEELERKAAEAGQ
ncbi:MAG: FHA domain-containing protein [Planctomycetes bacterium]|nr:FHA domain-containing protein [Planctomycetota bacterium]